METVDLLVIGSGGGGLTAALAAASSGRSVLVAEKLSTLGGSTALSGGALWIPNNPLMRAAGIHDSPEDAMTYIDALIGDEGPATSEARKRAYLDTGPETISFLLQEGIELTISDGYPDYYAGRPGGRTGGRSVEAAIFDGKRLGEDYKRLNRRPLVPFLALRAQDLRGRPGHDQAHGRRTLLDGPRRHQPPAISVRHVAGRLHATESRPDRTGQTRAIHPRTRTAMRRPRRSSRRDDLGVQLPVRYWPRHRLRSRR